MSAERRRFDVRSLPVRRALVEPAPGAQADFDTALNRAWSVAMPHGQAEDRPPARRRRSKQKT